MLRRTLIGFSLLAILTLISANRAKADDLFTYTINGGTYSWELPGSLTIAPPNLAGNGSFFELESVTFTENGSKQTTGPLDFYSLAQGGGFEFMDSILLNEFGAQLYTGSESSPTFLLGKYTLQDATANGTLTGLTGTLVISSVSTPEPSSLLMLAIGALCLMGFAAKRLSTVARPTV